MSETPRVMYCPSCRVIAIGEHEYLERDMFAFAKRHPMAVLVTVHHALGLEMLKRNETAPIELGEHIHEPV